MFEAAALGAYVAAAVALILSPGPDTIYVLARSVGDGRTAGVASAAGISAGVLVHTLGAVVGLSALFRASAIAFAAVTYLGAAYLVFLGVRTIRDDDLEVGDAGNGGETANDRGRVQRQRDDGDAVSATGDGATGGIGSADSSGNSPFLEAATVNVLNPQVAVFFLAFLPQFVNGSGGVELQLATLGAIYAALTMCYLGAVAVASSAVRHLLAARPGVGTAVRWLTGLVLVGLGLRLFVLGVGA